MRRHTRDSFYASTRVTVICWCGFHERSSEPVKQPQPIYIQKYIKCNSVTPLYNNHSYPIVMVDMEAITDPFTGNKSVSLRLAAAYEGLILSTRPPSVVHRWCVCRNLMTTGPLHCHRRKSHICRSAHGTGIRTRLLLWRWAVGDGAAARRERRQRGVQWRSDRRPTVACKSQILAGWVEKPGCLEWERQPSFNHRNHTVHPRLSLSLSLPLSLPLSLTIGSQSTPPLSRPDYSYSTQHYLCISIINPISDAAIRQLVLMQHQSCLFY